MDQKVTKETDNGDTLLARFERADGEIRIAWRSFKGSQYLDCRAFFQADDGRWLATKRGCTLRASDLSALADAVAKAQLLAAKER